ncbi:MAG: TonB-dependent receptor plug domain-containing protein [Flavobacteriales bacterium]
MNKHCQTGLHPAMHLIRHLPLVTHLLFAACPCLAQQDSLPARMLQLGYKSYVPDSASIADDEKVSIANLTEEEIRHSSANVLVFTRKQIEASGARDFLEFVRFVPGFSLGVDVDDVIGLGARGLWAHEGKILIMLDGIPLNEYNYGTVALYQRLHLDNIERIEIINGPGSVVYGGSAALGVINIISNTAEVQEGVFQSVRIGSTKDAIITKTMSLSGCHLSQNKTYISYSLSKSDGLKSVEKRWPDDTTLIDLRQRTQVENTEGNFSLMRNGVRAKFFFNAYDFDTSESLHQVQMRTTATEVEKLFKLGSAHSLKATFNHTDQLPWQYINTADPEELGTNNKLKRNTLSMLGHARLNSKLNLNYGMQFYKLASWQLYDATTTQAGANSKECLKGAAAFMQMRWLGKAGVIDAGLRGELSEIASPVLSPRISYSKVKKNAHFKANWSRAFKLPTFQNIALGPDSVDIVTENVTTLDVQIGYKFRYKIKAQLTAYTCKIENPIVYVYDGMLLDNYINRQGIGSRGIEFFISQSTRDLAWFGSYSLYRPHNRAGRLPESELPEEMDAFIGMPNHKMTMCLQYHLSRHISVAANCVYQSSAYYAIAGDEEAGEMQYEQTPANVSCNIFTEIKPGQHDRIWIRLGCNNVTGANYRVLPAYNSGELPLSTYPREFRLELRIRLDKY